MAPHNPASSHPSGTRGTRRVQLIRPTSTDVLHVFRSRGQFLADPIVPPPPPPATDDGSPLFWRRLRRTSDRHTPFRRGFPGRDWSRLTSRCCAAVAAAAAAQVHARPLDGQETGMVDDGWTRRNARSRYFRYPNRTPGGRVIMAKAGERSYVYTSIIERTNEHKAENGRQGFVYSYSCLRSGCVETNTSSRTLDHSVGVSYRVRFMASAVRWLTCSTLKNRYRFSGEWNWIVQGSSRTIIARLVNEPPSPVLVLVILKRPIIL